MNRLERRFHFLNMEYEAEQTSSELRGREIIFLSLTALVCMLFFSRSSPFYPMNNWQDSNCFFTMGKAILSGKVMYRDIYEQKGPILYFIHAFAALVSRSSFIGVFFVEVVAAAFTLIYQYKMIRLYTHHPGMILLMPALAVFMYTNTSFWLGDSAEELCLPVLTWSLWVGLQLVHTEKLPRLSTCVWLGVWSGCVLWIKFNLLGLYAGWIIVPMCQLLARKLVREFFRLIGGIAAGVCLISVPVLLYFAVNNALKDLFTIYFYNNIFVYSQSAKTSAVQNILSGLATLVDKKRDIAILAMEFLGLCMMSRRRLMDGVFILLGWFTSAAFIFWNAVHWPYYRFILMAFLWIGFLPVAAVLQSLLNQKKRALITAALTAEVLCCAACVWHNEFFDFLFTPKEELPQYQFAEIIDSVPDSTLLNYGELDAGFYFAADKVPVNRFFCELNIALPEMMEEQNRMAAEGTTTFIVTRDKQLHSDRYKQVASSEFYHEYKFHTYYLYQRI